MDTWAAEGAWLVCGLGLVLWCAWLPSILDTGFYGLGVLLLFSNPASAVHQAFPPSDGPSSEILVSLHAWLPSILDMGVYGPGILPLFFNPALSIHQAFPPSSSGDVCGWRGHRVAAVPVTQAQGKPALSCQRQSQERLKASLAGLCSEAQSGREIMPECYQPCAGRGCVATPTRPRLCSSLSEEECSFPSI